MAMMFYMTPGSCSTGIHILLETLELPFQVTVLNLPAGDHRRPDYLSLNPKGTIPALRLGSGEVLTEFQAIAYYLARRHPRAGLLPDDPLRAAQALSLMDHVVGTIHGQGWTRVFTPDAYLLTGLLNGQEDNRDAAVAALAARGREIVSQGFALVEALLDDDGRLTGQPEFGIADAALFYTEFWADRTGLSLPPRCLAHYRRVRARPVVQQVLREEGYRG